MESNLCLVNPKWFAALMGVILQDVLSGQELVREYGPNDLILIPPRSASHRLKWCSRETLLMMLQWLCNADKTCQDDRVLHDGAMNNLLASGSKRALRRQVVTVIRIERCPAVWHVAWDLSVFCPSQTYGSSSSRLCAQSQLSAIQRRICSFIPETLTF